MRLSEWRNRLCVMAALALVASAGAAMAQDGGEATGQDLPPGISEEMMAAWQKAASPGPEHERLAAMAGNWTFSGTFWMAPEAPPETSTGTAEREMTLGGRVLVERVKSEMMGQPFEGFGLSGFDNVSGKYWGTWNDNMGTGLMIAQGTCAEDGTCEFTGTWNDAMVNGPKTVRMTMKADADREVHAMYDKAPDGTEFKSMELVYTRSK